MGRQLFSHLWRAVEETKEPLIPGVTRLGGRPGRRPPERSSSSPSPEWLPLTPSGHLPSNELLLGSKKAPGETATTSRLSAWGHCFLKQSSPGLLHCTSRRAHPEGCPPPHHHHASSEESNLAWGRGEGGWQASESRGSPSLLSLPSRNAIKQAAQTQHPAAALPAGGSQKGCSPGEGRSWGPRSN